MEIYLHSTVCLYDMHGNIFCITYSTHHINKLQFFNAAFFKKEYDLI